MILLPIVFLLMLLYIYAVSVGKIKPVSISIPVPKALPTPTPLSLPTPTLAPAQNLLEIESDLSNIDQDIQKVKKEDKRFIPPSFIFELGF